MWLIDGPIGAAAGRHAAPFGARARVNIVTEPSHLFHSLLVLEQQTGTSPPKHTHTHYITRTCRRRSKVHFFFPFVILSTALNGEKIPGSGNVTMALTLLEKIHAGGMNAPKSWCWVGFRRVKFNTFSVKT